MGVLAGGKAARQHPISQTRTSAGAWASLATQIRLYTHIDSAAGEGYHRVSSARAVRKSSPGRPTLRMARPIHGGGFWMVSMRRAWAGLVAFIERVTPVRAIVTLEYMLVLAVVLLMLSSIVGREAPEPLGLDATLANGLEVSAEEIPDDDRPQPPPPPEVVPVVELLPTSTPLPIASDDLNILLLGSDRRPGRDPSWRTDTIIVVAIRPRAGLVAMMSVPRDLWVNIPGYGYQRINVADYAGERRHGKGGGPRLVAETLQQNLRIPVHAYVRVNFAGLERIVDAVGGVTVTVERSFDEPMDDGSGRSWRFRLRPGTQLLDGRTALAYARSRRGSSDFDRSKRQQQVLLAIRDAALRPAILPQVPALLAALWDAVDTDLKPAQILSLVGLARQLQPSSYRTCVFDRTMVRDWTTPGGAMVLLPNRPRIEQVWAQLTTP